MRTAQDIILKPVITEDSMDRLQANRYTFSVKGKQKRMGRSVGYRPDWKKAIVTLEGDKTIEFFEGLF